MAQNEKSLPILAKLVLSGDFSEESDYLVLAAHPGNTLLKAVRTQNEVCFLKTNCTILKDLF